MSILSGHETYDALGPFPLGTRELPFLSSPLHAFGSSAAAPVPLDPFLTSPVGTSYPSAYGTNGSASWATLRPDDEGWLDVEWAPPLVDWVGLRRTEGWAGLQHLSLLRSEIVVPAAASYVGLLVQGHAWAIVPQDRLEEPVVWHTGDIYAFSESLGGGAKAADVYGQAVSLHAGKHWIYLKVLYEIRMFGDPGARNPTIHLKFTLSQLSVHARPATPSSSELGEQTVLRNPMTASPRAQPDIRAYGPSAGMAGLGDVIDGWVWGDVGGIALRAGQEPIEVLSVALMNPVEGLSVSLRTPSRLAPHQLRPLTLEINQTEALSSDVTKLNLVVSTSVGDVALALPLAHYRSRRSATVRFVFRDRDGTAAYAEAHPPTNSDGPQDAVVLALHGAGVETDSAFWTDAVAPRPRSWILFPTGRTAWGYDWHAASTENVWAARRELSRLLVSLGKEPLSDRNIVIGHSNGGQGATHVFLHHPDEFHAALSAAAYIKIQAYVPYTQWTSAHHVDPALLGLLMTGLAGNDEDVLAPNGFGLGRALVHGREDDNVPVWHGREVIGLHAQHSRNATLIEFYEEVPDASHWFDGILSSPFVERFLAEHSPIESDRYPPVYPTEGFELVVANPDEQGSKRGFRITQLDRVGRLARLVVGPIEGDGVITIAVRNALRFTFDRSAAPAHLQDGATFVVDGRRLSLPSSARSSSSHHGSQGVTFYRPHRSAPWKVTAEAATTLDPVRRYGPLISILLSSGPLVLIVPTHAAQHERVARRIAHDAWVYGRLDARIVTDEQLKAELGNDRRRDSLHGSWVVIGGKENAMAGLLQSTPLRFPGPGLISVRTADGEARTYDPINNPSTGILALHPHPLNAEGLALVLAGTDASGLERAFRIFPVRTGTPSLDWMIVGHEADWKGAGGLLGAGWWNNAWGWEESGSWLS